MKLIIFFLSWTFSFSNWGPTGHRALAELASYYLTDTTKTQIKRISDRETPVNASTYADDIK